MRRLHQHGVPGLQQGIKFLQHIGHGGRTAYAGGIHAGIASALGDERGQLSHADEAVQGKGGRMGPYATAKSPSSPISPSTAIRRPATSVAAKVESDARIESGLAL